MFEARLGHTATLLRNDRLLVVGGTSSFGASKTAAVELLNLLDGTWSNNISQQWARSWHTATQLESGRILVVGGAQGLTSLASTVLYEPDTNSWRVAGALARARSQHTATRLPGDKVLVVGGRTNEHCCTNWTTTELFDPDTATWSSTGSTARGYLGHTATLLDSSRVLVVGNCHAELYDIAAGTWSSTGAPHECRLGHTATLLPSGKVLVVGGTNSTSAEVYDPAAGVWSFVGGMPVPRGFHTATLLPDGRVLLLGGELDSSGVTARLYDPVSGNWIPLVLLSRGRQGHTATWLPDYNVVVVGGRSETYPLASAEWVRLLTQLDSVSAPRALTTEKTATFQFSAALPDVSFSCSLDGAAFSACSSPQHYEALADGEHHFQVFASNAQGALDSAPASHRWVVDTVFSPNLNIQVPTLNQYFSTGRPRISGTSEPGSVVHVFVDGNRVGAVSSNEEGNWELKSPVLKAGRHGVSASATDRVGHESAPAVVHSFTISPPETLLDTASAPAVSTRATEATFSFSSTFPGASFSCDLDGTGYFNCSSPMHFPSLSRGTHSFLVFARGVEGAEDPTPAVHIWTIDTTAPSEPVIHVPAPAQRFPTSTPVFSGAATSHSTVRLFVDGAQVGEGQVNEKGLWEISIQPIEWGEHTATAMAIDPVGNESVVSRKVPFSTIKRGNYGMSCAAGRSANPSWLLVVLLLPLLRRACSHGPFSPAAASSSREETSS